jgi:NADPH-dependent ferric siderophore reductase
MARVTLAGPELEDLRVEEPAASVRVLLPSAAGAELVVPEWAGNEFLLPDGQRPTIRTLTPRRLDADRSELDVEVVIHEDGAASKWAKTVRSGDPAAVSGPAHGYNIDPDSPSFFLAGDETAIPAISQLLECLPAGRSVHAQIEIVVPEAKLALPERPDATVSWRVLPSDAPPGTALVAAVRDTELDPGSRAWVAGEAAAVQRIRRELFEARGLPRPQASIRGYWKHGRKGGSRRQSLRGPTGWRSPDHEKGLVPRRDTPARLDETATSVGRCAWSPPVIMTPNRSCFESPSRPACTTFAPVGCHIAIGV